jgi:hypothetical protein
LICVTPTHVCALFQQQGMSCGATQFCADGLACVNGSCAAAVTAMSAPCSIAGAGCDMSMGLACNGATSTCQNLVLAQPGGACDIVADQNQACVAGTCVHGACIAKGLVGDACDVANDPGCITNVVCIASSDGGTTGTCQPEGSGTCP